MSTVCKRFTNPYSVYLLYENIVYKINMNAQIIKKYTKRYEPKPIQPDRYQKGHYWVLSSRYKQLWYKIILRPAENEVYCTCNEFKSIKQICKYVMKVIQSK